MASFNATVVTCDADNAAELLGATHNTSERVAVVIDTKQFPDWEQAVCNFMGDARHCVLMRPRGRSDGNCDRCVNVKSDPWLPSEMVRSIAVALGFASEGILGSVEEISGIAQERMSLEQAEAKGQLILVAEDNEINREVVARQLALLGYTHVVGEDGVEALELWQKHRIGLVLTDCHMPHMDGYELSAAIRSEERGTGSRVPIIAVTANALKGEAERCRASGMDDYLTKPVALRDFKKLLQKWMPASTGAAHVEEGNMENSSADNRVMELSAGAVPVEPDVLRNIVGDDPAIIASFLKKFIPQAQAILSDLEEAYSAKDPEAVRFHSHKLKSSARAIGALSLGELCANLEKAGRINAWTEIEDLYPELEPAIASVVVYIENC